MGSLSRSQIFQDIEENKEVYQQFEIENELHADDQLFSQLPIPLATDIIFSLSDIPERPTKKQKTDTPDVKGTQELMRERIQGWRPYGRILDASSQDSPNLGNNKLDVILRDSTVGGDLSIMALMELKKLPANFATKEFTHDEMGQVVEYGVKVMNKHPWRPHIFVVLSDTRRFKFFKVCRAGSNQQFIYRHSKVFLDVRGWQVFRALVCQSAEFLGYQESSITGWKIRDILGSGGTAVVLEVSDINSETSTSRSIESVVAKLYLGDEPHAREYRERETRALQALATLTNIPHLVSGPNATVSGQPILLKTPRGVAAGDGVFPLVPDYSPLVDVLKQIHVLGWLHNDVAPANIFFRKVANQPLTVFLNDFGSATYGQESQLAVKSRPLFYSHNTTSGGFACGPAADLRALLLSIFLLTHKNSFDNVQVTTANQLEEVVRRLPPWNHALDAAWAVNYDAIKRALNSTLS